jgi:NMD protein affecting ribosome stability and mRNA decay
MSYNNMNTILRQVCRHCAIVCKSERKYDKSKTQIVYHVLLDEADEADEEANKAYAEKAEQTEKADEPPI